MEELTMSGIKYDGAKPDMTHVPIEAMWAMGEAFTYGAKKYEADNFREGLAVRRQIAAALRHIYQFLDEGDTDKESGCKHLGSAMASIAMACYTVEHHPDLDDRYFKKQERKLNQIALAKFKDE
jgi:pterin-4a-carbinolamine dehydratase